MGNILTSLLLDLIAIVVSNWVLLLFFLIALIASKTKKGSLTWFAVGIAVQAFGVFGMFIGLYRNPGQGMNYLQVCELIGFVVFSVGGILAINRIRRGK